VRYDEKYKSKVFLRLILTLIPILAVVYFIDLIASTYYNSSLERILTEFLKSIGVA